MRLLALVALAAVCLPLQSAAADDTATTASVPPDASSTPWTATPEVLFETMKGDERRKLFGDNAVEWYVDEASGLLKIGVLDLRQVTAGTEESLRGRVQFYEVSQGSRAYTRLSDAVPWYGGLRIYNGATTISCSGDFNVVRGTSEYLLSAGHCTGGGAATTWTNNAVSVGSTFQWEVANNGWDDQIISFTSGLGGSPNVFVGSNASGVTAVVKSAVGVPVGGALCFAGSFTGENCTGLVGARNACHTFSDGITTCNLAIATSTNGMALFSSGDSGGTVYKNVSGGVSAAGMIIGTGLDGSGSMQYYYHEVPALLAHWGATLQTG